MNLVEYAKEELKRIGMVDSGEPYNDAVTKAILDLLKLFDSQGHSGFTAPYTARTFHRLAMYKPLTPLTGEDDEWHEIGDGCYQNNRYSAVFKDRDGRAYNSEGKTFTDDGEVWYTSKDSRVYITFPYAVPDHPEYVYLNKKEADKEKDRLIEELKELDYQSLATALMYSKYYLSYGEDVTKQWVTATQQSAIIEKAYNKGYYEALHRMSEQKLMNVLESKE